MADKPIYPNVSVQLTGMDGNAFNMIGRVGMEMRRAGVANVDIVAFREEAMAGNYDHVLQTILKYVDVA